MLSNRPNGLEGTFSGCCIFLVGQGFLQSIDSPIEMLLAIGPGNVDLHQILRAWQERDGTGSSRKDYSLCRCVMLFDVAIYEGSNVARSTASLIGGL